MAEPWVHVSSLRLEDDWACKSLTKTAHGLDAGDLDLQSVPRFTGFASFLTWLSDVKANKKAASGKDHSAGGSFRILTGESCSQIAGLAQLALSSNDLQAVCPGSPWQHKS